MPAQRQPPGNDYQQRKEKTAEDIGLRIFAQVQRKKPAQQDSAEKPSKMSDDIRPRSQPPEQEEQNAGKESRHEIFPGEGALPPMPEGMHRQQAKTAHNHA